MRRLLSVATLSLAVALVGCGDTPAGSGENPSAGGDVGEETAPAPDAASVVDRWLSGECPDAAAMSEALGFPVNDIVDGPDTAGARCLWGDMSATSPPDEVYTIIGLWANESYADFDPVARRESTEGTPGIEVADLPEYGPESFTAAREAAPIGCDAIVVDAESERSVVVRLIDPPEDVDACDAATAIVQLP